MTTRFEETTVGQAILGPQMLFFAFGALVLVPIPTGLNPNAALSTAGAGTLLFQVITGFSVPVFLASSFAFIAPIIYGAQTWGIPATMGGLLASGMVYIALSGLIAVNGRGFIERTFPPIVVAPVIIVIDLSLASAGVNMAKGLTGDGAAVLVESNHAVWISAASLLVTVAVAAFAKGMLRLLRTGLCAGRSQLRRCSRCALVCRASVQCACAELGSHPLHSACGHRSRHCTVFRWEGGRGAQHHAGARNGWHHGVAVWHNRRHWHEYAGQFKRRSNRSAQPRDRTGLRARRCGVFLRRIQLARHWPNGRRGDRAELGAAACDD